MNPLSRPRLWFSIVALACACLLGYALYEQHVNFIDPCPLCVFQRVAFIFIGLVSLVAAIHGPGKAGRWAYGLLVLVGSIAGAAIAIRHLWLQNLPPGEVPECGAGLNYMLETMPFSQVLSEVFRGSGECAEVYWRFLGLTMPGWTLLWYTVFTIGTIVILVRANRPSA